jgi:hypothetical protein
MFFLYLPVKAAIVCRVIYFLAAGNQNARSGCQGVTLFTWGQEEIIPEFAVAICCGL